MTAGHWFAEGLRFACTRCGNCCTGSPGEVLLTREESDALAAHLGLRPADFHWKHTRRLSNGKLSLMEKPNHDCVLWDRARGCTVHAHRPGQCRSWPFWRANLVDREAWDAAAAGCPGMNQGELRAADEVAQIAAHDGTSGRIGHGGS